MVRDQFAQAFGPSVQIGEIHASFFPPQLELIDVFLKDNSSPDPFFHASRLRIDLTIFSFLQEHMESEGLLIEEPSIHILRNKDGSWNFPQAWTSREKGVSVIGAWLSPFKLTVVDGEIMVIDVFEREYPKSLAMKGIQLHMSNPQATSPMDFSLSARFVDHESESPIAVYGSIDQFSQLLNWFKNPMAPLPGLALQGRGQLSRSEIVEFAKFLEWEALLFEIQGDLELQGKVRLGPGKNGYQVVLSEVAIETEALSVKGDANFSGLFEAEPPTIFINWSSTPINLATILEVVPVHSLPTELVDAIGNNIVGGKIEVLSATLSGSLREELGLSLVGDIRVADGRFDLGEEWGVATQIEGLVKVEPDQIRLLDLQGNYDSIPVTSGTGVIEFRNSGPWLVTELQGDVPVVKLLDILKKVFDWGPPHSMAALRGLEGSGPMRIHFAGPLQDPKKIRFQDAFYVPQAVSLMMPGLKKPLTGVTGNLSFSTTQVTFEQIRALWRNSEIGVHGAIRFADGKYFDDIQIQGRLQGEDALNWLGTGNPGKEWILAGPLQFEGMLSGSLHTPRVALTLNGNRVKIAVPHVLEKPVGIDGTLNLEFQVTGGNRVSFDRLGFSLPNLQASGKGVFPLLPSGPLSASFVLEPVTISKLPPGVSILGNAVSAGTLEISLHVDGQGKDWRRWKKNGWVALTNGRLEIAGIQAPLTQTLVRLKLQNHEMAIKRFEWQMGDSQARIEGVIHAWETQPVVKFSAFGEQFDLDLLIPKGSRSPVRTFLEQVAASMRVSGNLAFDGAFYKDLQFPKLTGQLQIHKEVLAIEELVGKLEKGDLKGRFLVHLPLGHPASMKTWISLAEVPLDVLERSFLKGDVLNERMLTGTLSLEGMIEGNGKTNDGILASLHGNLNCLIRDGRIQRGTIVPKILSLLNLPTLLQGRVDLEKDGYPFDTQSATIVVTKGVFTSQNIVMNGPILKMTAAGTYDAVKDELNLVAAASPFGPYFDLLKKVSLFRLLLEGDETGIEMALFEVKGPLQDPQVQALPIESFASGLTGFAKLAFRVLKNTVMLPTNILFPKGDPKLQKTESQKTRDSPKDSQ